METEARETEPHALSLESRDNPFLPGGELSREAEDLLSRATIIRHHFYLNDDEKRQLLEQQQQEQQQQGNQQRNAKHVHIIEYTDEIVENPDEAIHFSNIEGSPPHFDDDDVEERISPHSQANSLAAATPASSQNGGDSHQLRPRENGKVKDTSASPDNEKLAIPDGEHQSQAPVTTDRPGAGDVPAQTSGSAELQVHEPGKKRRNKCCSIM
uniref:Uncharacterized protein n=1 Tax=Arion vulgaris TaxID=1028688 RepID=A0A0B7BQT4_9EUPU